MRMHRTFLVAAVATALGAMLAAGGCSTNRQGDDASPSYLTIDFTLLPLAQNVNCACFLQFSSVTVQNLPKAPSLGVSSFLDVRLDDYVVEWKRVDGGTVHSATERFPGNLLVPINGSSSLANYEFMGPDALLKPPLDQLFPFNGGIDRETGNVTIRQQGTVTFEGHNLSGQAVTGQGVFGMNFLYIPPAARPGSSRSGHPSSLPKLALRPLTGKR